MPTSDRVHDFRAFLGSSRAQLRFDIPVQLADGKFKPFVLAGLGGITVLSTEGTEYNELKKDTDFIYQFGAGAKYAFTDLVFARLDARLIETPTDVPAAGDPPKTIAEFVGHVNTGTSAVSVAVMESPKGWQEPGQAPDFDEFTLVLEGELVVEHAGGEPFVVRAGSAVHAAPGEWVRYSTPNGAEYVAVCLPAFSPDTVHRDP